MFSHKLLHIFCLLLLTNKIKHNTHNTASHTGGGGVLGQLGRFPIVHVCCHAVRTDKGLVMNIKLPAFSCTPAKSLPFQLQMSCWRLHPSTPIIQICPKYLIFVLNTEEDVKLTCPSNALSKNWKSRGTYDTGNFFLLSLQNEKLTQGWIESVLK